MSPDEALDMLELSEKADSYTLADVQRQYKTLIAFYHPDRRGSTRISELINEARDVLKAELERKAKGHTSQSTGRKQSESDQARKQRQQYEERQRRRAWEKTKAESDEAREQRQAYEERERQKRSWSRPWGSSSSGKKERASADKRKRPFVTESGLLFFQYARYSAAVVLVFWGLIFVWSGMPDGAVDSEFAGLAPIIARVGGSDDIESGQAVGVGGAVAVSERARELLASSDSQLPILKICEPEENAVARADGFPLAVARYNRMVTMIEQLQRELADENSERRQGYGGENRYFLGMIPLYHQLYRGFPENLQVVGPLRADAANCGEGMIEHMEFQP